MSGYGHNNTTKKRKSWDVKEPVVRADDDPKSRVDLNPQDFDRLLVQKGSNICIYRSSYCPNVKSIDGAEHEIDCPLCNGTGYIDLDPIDCKAFIQTQDLEKIQTHQGYHDGNSVLMSFPIGIEMQYFTRIDLKDFTNIYYQRVMRKPATLVDVLKFKACRVNLIVDKDGTRYFQDQDFRIDPNGNVLWTGSRKPVDNLPYSIHYECHVQFRAVKAMHSLRFTQFKGPGEPTVQHMKMPEQWLCTKEFLLRRKDINTGNDLMEGPFDVHTNTTDDND